MKLSLRQRSSLAVLVAAGLASSALVLVSLTWSRLRSSIGRAELAQTRRLLLEELFSEVKDVESGERGYIITGNTKYLDRYREAEAVLNPTLDELFQASLGDAKLSEALLDLRQLVAELKGAGTVSITIRDREGYAAARDHFLNTRDAPVDSIRHQMQGLIATQDTIIRDAAAAMRTDLRFGLLAGMTAGVAALVSGAVALGLWQHQQVRAERERQLVYEKKQAEASDQQKSTFLATVSHEIRTPMSAILGFSEMLRAEATNERQHRFAGSIVTAGRTLLQLINDVLDISKIEAGRLEIRLQPADLRQVADFVRTLFSEQAAAKGLKFDTQVADSVPATILMDVTRLRQILVNVVGNAIKFTESGHVTVRIDARPTDDDREYSKPVPQPRRVTIEIHVEDSGVGILPEERERIFRPFVQGARTTEARQPGTGLGLSIVRRLTELMGGAIHLDSEPGRGTKFHLIFPDIEVSARLARREGEEPDVTFADFEPFDVLVVDDNPSNQAVVSEFLGNAAREVRFASDGRDAVDAVSRYRPDIVLMDLQMPGMDGHEALDRIRRLPGCELLPVLAVTASSLSVTESGKRWKFDGYVRKPFSRARLYREISQFLPKKPVTSRGFLPEPEPAGGPGTGSHGGGNGSLPDGVIAELRDIENNDWPVLCATMSMSEVRAFALRLVEISRAHECATLEQFGRQLAEHAEGVLLSSVEASLAQFPHLVRRLAGDPVPSPP